MSPADAESALWDVHALLQCTMARMDELTLPEGAITEDASLELRRLCRMAAARVSDVASSVAGFAAASHVQDGGADVLQALQIAEGHRHA